MHAVCEARWDETHAAAILPVGRTIRQSELTADEVSALMDLTAELNKEEAA